MTRTSRARATGWALLAAVALPALAGCGDDRGTQAPAGDEGSTPRPPGEELALDSEAFANGERIPDRYTCDGEDVSPPLAWDELADGASELALVVTDPDAPDGSFVHWVVAGLDPADDGLDAGQVPTDAVVGTNDFGDRAYGGPCPPAGDPAHRYVFTLYTADEPLPVERGATAQEVEAALAERVLARGELVGTYRR